MPEIADVTAATTISTTWGNLIRDRTVQRYADLSTRASENPTPADGDLAFLEDSGDLDVYFDGAWRHLNGPPVGTIVDHAGGSVPPGWLVCDGSAISRTTYAGLFGQIGTIWGVGDNSTTFNVPDLRERVTRGKADSGTGDTVGDLFGADTHTHTGPSHTHTNPNTASDNHNHSFADTSSSSGSHNHSGKTGLANQGGVASGSGFIFTPDHEHPISSDGAHTHAVSGTTGADSHAHSQGNTGSGGTGNTGSSSTIQKSAAVNKLIRY